MTGKSHKAIGFVAGLSLAMYLTSTTGNPLAVIAVITSTAGAMMPDIDHDNSKIGSARKQVFRLVRSIVTFVSIWSIFGFAAYAYLTKNVSALLIAGVAIVVMFGFTFLATNPKIKKQMNFLVKHRGIMHTLFVPALMLVAGKYFANPILESILTGFALGYFSHLFADTLTVAGTPLLWPLSKRNISLLPVKTGTVWEYILTFLLCGGLICLSFYLTVLN